MWLVGQTFYFGKVRVQHSQVLEDHIATLGVTNMFSLWFTVGQSDTSRWLGLTVVRLTPFCSTTCLPATAVNLSLTVI